MRPATMIPEEITSYLRYLHEGEKFNLRLIHDNRLNPVLNQYLDDPEKVPGIISRVDKYHVYTTINPIAKSIVGRGAGDADITRRRWIPLDIDPIREPNRDRQPGVKKLSICATDTEVLSAGSRCAEIMQNLAERGWTTPAVCRSGNGYYLLYPCDLPNDAGANILVHRFTQWADTTFSDRNVSIDSTVHNPSRILRVMGTVNFKGKSTRERPHRTCTAIDLPARGDLVTLKMLREITEGFSPKTMLKAFDVNDDGGEPGQFDAEDFFEQFDIGHVRSAPYLDGRKWVLAVCPFCQNTDSSAYVNQRGSGRMGFACQHDSCQTGTPSGKPRNWKEYRAFHDEEYRLGLAEYQFDADFDENTIAATFAHADDDSDSDSDVDELPVPDLCPPGLLREVIELNLATADQPQPELALAGALCLLATLLGPNVVGQDKYRTKSNMYVISVAPSGVGKEWARRLNRDLCTAVGHTSALRDSIGSHAGLLQVAASVRSVMFQTDEIGRLLQTVNSAHNSHLFKVVDMLLRLYSSANSTFHSDALKDRAANLVIEQPHVVLHGTTTCESFWAGMTKELIQDGLLGRALVFFGNFVPQPEKSDEEILAEKDERVIPESLIREMSSWIVRAEDEVLVGRSDAAKTRLIRHYIQIEARKQEDTGLCAAIWGRAAERTAKLALLAACSRCGPLGDVQIELEDANWAIAVSNYLTRRIVQSIESEVGEMNPFQKRKVDRILHVFAKSKSLNMSDLSRMTIRYMSGRERAEVLQDMVLAGILWKTTEGRTTTYHLAHKRFLSLKTPKKPNVTLSSEVKRSNIGDTENT